MTTIASEYVGQPIYGPHWESWRHMITRFSRDPNRLHYLNGRPFGKEAAFDFIVLACERLGVPAPVVAFGVPWRDGNSQRVAYPPRADLRLSIGERAVAKEEVERGVPYPEHGVIYLKPKWLAANTVAHELGHHAVHCLDPHGTPGHGKVWVGRFEDAAEAVAIAFDDYGRSRGEVPILVSDERLGTVRVSP